MSIKTANVKYIESGAFQGSEEDVSEAEIKYGEACVVMGRDAYKELLGSTITDTAWRDAFEEVAKRLDVKPDMNHCSAATFAVLKAIKELMEAHGAAVVAQGKAVARAEQAERERGEWRAAAMERQSAVDSLSRQLNELEDEVINGPEEGDNA